MTLSIGLLAKAADVKVPTIRFYEEIGLLPEPRRAANDRRVYDADAVRRLAFIRHARDLGLNIDAIRELIALSQHREMPCEGADRIAAEHLADVREKIASLKKLEHELERIVSHCHGHSIEDCYVIRALSDHGMCEGEH